MTKQYEKQLEFRFPSKQVIFKREEFFSIMYRWKNFKECDRFWLFGTNDRGRISVFDIRPRSAESKGFEPSVGISHTAFREPHLKPLGQLSTKTGIFDDCLPVTICSIADFARHVKEICKFYCDKLKNVVQ